MQDFDAVKEDIRQRIDLVGLVSEHVALTRKGSDFWGCCPFHREKTASFHVIPSKMIFYCFGCKAGGDVFKFVQLREGVSFGEALRILADRAGIELTSGPRSDSSEPSRTDLARVNAWAADVYRRQLLDQRLGESTRAYLAQRGISDESSERFGLGLAVDDASWIQRAARLAGFGDTLLRASDLVRVSERGAVYDTFRHRVIFPIRDTTKRVVGFGGRALGDSPAKYLNTAQNRLFDKGRLLYGLDVARSEIASSGRAIVVEGYTDCIACHQAGFGGTVATLGTSMTDDHVGQLARHASEIVLVFDSDDAGNAAAERALSVALRHGLSVRLAFVPEGKDPADFLRVTGPEAFASVLNSATDALRFVWGRTLARYDAQKGDSGRRRAILDFVNLISSLVQVGTVDAIQQGLIANQIAKLLNLPGEQVHALFAQSQRASRHPSAASQAATGPVENNAPVAASAEQAALTNMLEVLLNEPGMYDSVRDVFDPQRFENPVLRRIGTVVAQAADRMGEFSLVEILDRFPDPDDGRRITELHIRGQQRGNWTATLESAAEDLRRIAKMRETMNLTRRRQDAPTGQKSTQPDDSDMRLRVLHKATLEHRHFVAPHHSSVARDTEA